MGRTQTKAAPMHLGQWCNRTCPKVEMESTNRLS